MDRKLRRCSVCGTEYKYCAKSVEDKGKPSWYFAFGSLNCHDIYDVTSKYENGQLSANEAKKQLDELDLSNLDKFGSSYKKTIKNINTSATPVVETLKATEVNKDEVVNEETTDIVEEKVSKKSKKTKRVE